MKKKLIEKQEKKKLNATQTVERVLFWFILSTLVGSMAFIIVALAIGGFSKGVYGKGVYSNVGDLIRVLIAIILLLAPSFMEKKLNYKLPSFIYIMFVSFLFLSIYLGHVVGLYKKIAYYDTFVHTFSSMVWGLLSFSILKMISDNTKFKIKPWFIFLFSICFAVTLGVFWEFWEFFRDLYTGTNMQRFQNVATGENFVGQEALLDTMRDLLVDAFGAIIAGIIGYIAVKIDERNFEKLTIMHKKQENALIEKWKFEENADVLNLLVLSGDKTATSSIYKKRKTKINSLSILTDENGKELCKLQTKKVYILPFKDVDWQLAKLEGEFSNIKDWRENHLKFFKKHYKRFNENTKIEFEIFEVVEIFDEKNKIHK